MEIIPLILPKFFRFLTLQSTSAGISSGMQCVLNQSDTSLNASDYTTLM